MARALPDARSFCGMKHVGLNVAADPFYTMSYIGVNGGMVLGSGRRRRDALLSERAGQPPPCHWRQGSHAGAGGFPRNARTFTKLAYELSEQFDTPVLLRLTTRIAHSRSLVELQDRDEKRFEAL